MVRRQHNEWDSSVGVAPLGRVDGFRYREIMERAAVGVESSRLDVGRSDHLGPFLSFLDNDLFEVGGRACQDYAS